MYDNQVEGLGGCDRKPGFSPPSNNSDIGSCRNIRTWQSILDNLTMKSKQGGLVKAVYMEAGFEPKIKKVMSSISVR